jgi:hypothetical protein
MPFTKPRLRNNVLGDTSPLQFKTAEIMRLEKVEHDSEKS